MAQEQGIVVRRAKPSDAGRIAEFIERVWKGRIQVAPHRVLERFGTEGFLLAERSGAIVGMLGWRAENLVVRVFDLLIWPASESTAAVPALFAEMDQAAATLACEAALLFPPRPPSPAQLAFFEKLGYKQEVVSGMPKAWREAALEARLGDEDQVLIKRLREKRVLRPL